MTAYIARRLGQAAVVLLGLTLLTLALEHALPGSAARAILGPRATSAQLATFNHNNYLDRSLVVQYAHYLSRILHGDLGFSYRLNRSVSAVIAQEVPRDLVLVGTSLVLAVLIAIPVGATQAIRRNRPLDHLTTATSLILYSTPSYALGLLLISGLAISLKLFPAEAPQDASALGLIRHPADLVLPVLTLTLVSFAQFARYMRSTVIEVLSSDFIRTARSKGLPERLIVWRHVLRNSLAPVVTLVGLSLPGVLTGGLIVEQLFNFPGLGLQYFTAASQDDYPVMLGITLLVGAATVVGNLFADVAYAVLDPRVRYR
jgi:peptide/nickel transport system permease protein